MIKNERGFMLLNVVFLTLITSFAAMILINAAPRIRNPQATLRLTALYLANEQCAQLESLAVSGDLESGSYPFKGVAEDLTTENVGAPITFTVTTQVENGGGNLRTATVKVSWTFGGNDFELESERTMRIVQ